LLFEDRVQLPVWLQVTGRMHPLVLHFPLTLLFIGVVLEYLLTHKAFQHPAVRDVTSFIFCLFALSAAFTALFGFFLFKEGTYLGDEVSWHKWSGIAVSLLAVILVMIKERSSSTIYYATLGLSIICLVLAGHLGAEVTHGEGFLTEPFRKASNHVTPIENADSAVVFRDVVQPILNEKCVNCHNANRAKGDLILSDYEGIMKGGETRDAVVAGKAGNSLLYKYISLPMEDTLHMPPKDKLQLDREEIRLIGWWINTGAHIDTKYVELPRVDSIQPFMLARFHPKTGLDLLDIPFVEYDEIKQLNNPYRTVQQISATKPYVAVFLGSKKDFNAKDLTELKKVARQVVSVDLGNSAVKDNDLKDVAQFTHVQKLYLQNSDVSDEGVKLLKDLKFLEVLNLSGTKITNKTLEEVATWKSLRKLYLYNTNIDEKTVLAFKAAKQQLEVFNSQIDLSDSVYNAALTAPVIKIDSPFFRNSAWVDVKLSRGKVKYYYTLDGTEPTLSSTAYSEPFGISQSGELRVRATMTGWKDSRVVMSPLMKLGLRPPVITLETKPDRKYSGKLDSALVDGKAGGFSRTDKEYLGYLDQDLQVLFEMKEPTAVSQVALSLLEDIDHGVFMPGHIEVWTGNDKNQMSKAASFDNAVSVKDTPVARRVVTLSFTAEPVRFIRLKANRIKSLPGWYDQKKGKPAIFIDEVSIEKR
jgi:uncharacterized membrane protein